MKALVVVRSIVVAMACVLLATVAWADAPAVSTVAGTGSLTFAGDGGPSSLAAIGGPQAVAVVGGDIIVADSQNYRIRRISGSTATVTTIAGNGAPGFSDGAGVALNASFRNIKGLASDAAGNIYAADEGNHVIWKIAPGGGISIVAGTGVAGYSGDGAAANAALLRSPAGVTVDTAGNIFIADTGNHVIRKVNAADSVISTYAGNGTAGYAGDTVAASTSLSAPAGVLAGPGGVLYVADSGNQRVRVIDAAGAVISLVAGTGVAGYNGDGIPAVTANLSSPTTIARDAAGSLYVADLGNHRVRKIATDGSIATLAGNGVAGFSGDGGAAAAASLNSPNGIALDASLNVFVADTNNNRIRKVVPGPLVVVVNTVPAGLQVLVDGVLWQAPQVFNWGTGQRHLVTVNSPQAGAAGTRYAFANWSDGGAQAHEFVVTGSQNLTANFTTQYLLTVNAFPVTGGVVTPSAPAYFDAGSSVVLTADAAAGYRFGSFLGDGSGTVSPSSVIMDRPRTVTANFQVAHTITSSIAGLQISADNVLLTSPATVYWTAGETHSISFVTPQGAGDSRYVFRIWNDGVVLPARQVVAAATPAQYTATVARQFLLTISTNPPSAGVLSPSGSGYYDEGAALNLSATANAGYRFVNFTGDTPSASGGVLVMDRARTIVANFLVGHTFTSNIAGVTLRIDNSDIPTPFTFYWAPGESHGAYAPSPQDSSTAKLVFVSWEGNITLASRFVTSQATPQTYTATFKRQFLLTTSADPMNGGVVVPSNPAFYDEGARVQVTASAMGGYQFTYWSGDLSGRSNPNFVTVDGPKTVVARFTPVSVTNAPPVAVDMTPFTGAGTSQLFQFTFKDTDGAATIDHVLVKFHENYNTTANSCYLQYRAATRDFLLLDTAGVTWLGPSPAGTPVSLSNSACQLDASRSSGTGTGNDFTLTVALNFNPAFGTAGGRDPRKIVCLQAYDFSGSSGGTQCLGQWLPETNSVLQLPRYRGYLPGNAEHFFTSNLAERDALVNMGAMMAERPRPGDVFNQPTSLSGMATLPYYRMLQCLTADCSQFYHFWTNDRTEYKSLMQSSTSYFGEGIESHILGGPVQSTPGVYACPLYRLRFMGSFSHPLYHYALKDETDILAAGGGWSKMNVEGYLMPTVCMQCDALGNPSYDRTCNDEVSGAKRTKTAVDVASNGMAVTLVANAANSASGSVSAGELVRVYGTGFSRFAQVLLDGTSLPLTSSGDNYIEFAVPDWVAAKESVSLVVDQFGKQSDATVLPVVAASPAVFATSMLGYGPAGTVDANGTASFEVTGLGAMAEGKPALEMQVRVKGYAAKVLSVVPSANGAGRFTVTVQLPDEALAGSEEAVPLALEAGAFAAQPGVTLKLK